jgi:hypothetical protein
MRSLWFTPNSVRSVGGSLPATYGSKAEKRFLTWANPEIVGGLP